ncbi:sulfotransferase family protein [Aquibacillus sediminis]|uniref:sulfotransferase family protein n=1 Tax=Aquibacillus sediminis TaxID=2574734 RepID=UPI0011093BCB|nr:sulfotransferase [Aquibacillus sediminis]
MNFKEIISIHGVPRSGTTWLGQILDSSPEVRYKYQPLFSYAYKDRINLQSSKDDIYNFYKELYKKYDDFLDQTKQKNIGIHPTFLEKNEYPDRLVTKMVRYHFLIPHLLNNVSDLKCLLIVRNPCGSLKSWKNAPREFSSEWNFDEQWEFGQNKNNFRPEEYYGFHKWKEATKLFLEMKRQHKERVFLVKYENLVKNPVDMSEKIFDFFGLDYTSQTSNFIKDSTKIKQKDVYSVFKGKKDVNDWKNDLNGSIVNKVYQDIKGTELEQFL